MGKSSLKLDNRFVRKDGTCAVRVFVGYGTNLYLSTGVSVKDEEWDARTQMCIGRNAKILNSILSGILVRITARILELKEKGMFGRITKAQLKVMLTDLDLPEPPEEAKPTLGAMFKRVIGIKGERNKQLFEATLKKLSAYCNPDKVKFEDVNGMWLAGFSASMSGLSINTKAIHLRNLRNVVNYAFDEGITNNYPFRRFRIQTEETAMRVLPVATLRYYASATHLNKQYREYRDIFPLSFYLIGINICNLSKLTPESIVNRRLEYRRSKTGKLYSIRIEPEAQSIIDR